VNGQPVRFRNLLQQIQIAGHHIRFGDDAQLKCALAREFFEDCPRHLVSTLCRLIGIGGGAQRDRFVRLHPPEFMPQKLGLALLYLDLLLELHAIAHLHELVRVAGVAVAAAELASAIRIDCPCEWHLPLADATVQQGFRGQGEVFGVVTLSNGLAFRGQTGDANEARLLGLVRIGQ